MSKGSPKFSIERTSSPVSPSARAALLENPVFGRVFTDHMVTVRWREGAGWHDPKVGPRIPFVLEPACSALHYAQEIFEGLKAFRGEGNTLNLFRPEQNAQRFNSSARRMAMPELPEEIFLAALDALVLIDQAWIPDGDGSLYLRPFMFASQSFLGARPSAEYVFCVVACPVGSYFRSAKRALSVWVSHDYSRAAPGGTGAAKCGGNYAASLVAQNEATRHGCDQTVFLDSVDRRWVEELGSMNIFFVLKDGALITPPLTGTILPGITRSSLMHLARAKGMVVREESYAVDQWRADAASGRLREAFACGTAATVAAIGEVKDVHGCFLIGDGSGGSVAEALRAELAAIQRGRAIAPAGWIRQLDPSTRLSGWHSGPAEH